MGWDLLWIESGDCACKFGFVLGVLPIHSHSVEDDDEYLLIGAAKAYHPSPKGNEFLGIFVARGPTLLLEKSTPTARALTGVAIVDPWRARPQ